MPRISSRFRPHSPLRAPSWRALIAAGVAALALPSAALAAPATPTALRVNATGPQQVSLSWTAPPTNVNGYHVFRNGSLAATLAPTATNYLDQSTTALTNGVDATYTVDAFDGSGSSPKTAGQIGTPAAAFTLGACAGSAGATLASGHYKLNADLTQGIAASCFSFVGGSNLSLDCQGHTITQNGTADLLSLSNVSGAIISNCVFQQNADGKVAKVFGGSYALFTNDTFNTPSSANRQGSSLDIESSPHSIVGQTGLGNTFSYAYLEVISSPSAYVGANTLNTAGTTNPGGIWIKQSDKSVVVSNTIDGGYPGYPAPDSGLDDGIILWGPEAQLTVSSNTIAHTFDAGIEPISSLTYSHIDNNTISYVEFAGIGEYHDTDFANNVLVGNHIDHSPRAFEFTNDHQSSFALPASFRVTDNRFTGNVFTSPKTVDPYNGVAKAVEIIIAPSASAPGTPAVASGNVFTVNLFGALGAAPVFSPTTAVDTAQSTSNLCPSTSTTPIECLGKPLVSGGPQPQRSSNGAWTLWGRVDPHGETTTTKIEWGTTTSYGTSVNSLGVSPGSPTNVPILTTASIPAGTIIHWRTVATNYDGTTTGDDRSFVVPTLGRPVVSPGATPVRSATTGSWTLYGHVDAQGSNATTKIEWGTSTSYGHLVTSLGVSSGNQADVPIGIPIQTPGDTIHYRTIATNGTGTTTGVDQTYVIPHGSPVVTAGPAPVHNASGSWSVYGHVDPQGLSTQTWIEWGIQTDVDAGGGQQFPNSIKSYTVAPGAPDDVPILIHGYPSGTVIHYRTRAVNSDLTTYGTEQTITVP